MCSNKILNYLQSKKAGRRNGNAAYADALVTWQTEAVLGRSLQGALLLAAEVERVQDAVGHVSLQW